MEFTEKEILQDAIIAHKFMMHMYGQFGIECSTLPLRNLFNDLLCVSAEYNLKIFKIMNEKGYYPTNPAPTKDIKQTLKMHAQMQVEL